MVVDGWIGQVELPKRNATENVFLGISQNFSNNSFSEYFLKIYEVIFLRNARSRCLKNEVYQKRFSKGVLFL